MHARYSCFTDKGNSTTSRTPWVNGHCRRLTTGEFLSASTPLVSVIPIFKRCKGSSRRRHPLALFPHTRSPAPLPN